jgi:hypothetical protein
MFDHAAAAGDEGDSHPRLDQLLDAEPGQLARTGATARPPTTGPSSFWRTPVNLGITEFGW